MADRLDDRLGALGARMHEHSATSADDLDDVYGRRRRDQRQRRAGAVAGVAVAVLVVAAVITWLRPASSDSQHVQLGGTAPATGVLPAAPTTVEAPGPTTTDVPSTTEAPGVTVTATTVAGRPEPAPVVPLATGRGYQLLWPFTSLADALAWQADAGPGGHQPWHARAEDTALAFAAFLGVGDVDRVVSSIPDVSGAHVTVGFLNPAGQPVAVAVVHLVRLGSGDAPPWEVVGTDDILGLSLDVPRYGATVSSPVAVGGRITGVDEHVVVRAHRAGREQPVGSSPGVPAGGEGAPWSSSVAFDPGPGTVILVASTGGHLAAVERFAVTGVQVG
jgi:hypothetical protein